MKSLIQTKNGKWFEVSHPLFHPKWWTVKVDAEIMVLGGNPQRVELPNIKGPSWMGRLYYMVDTSDIVASAPWLRAAAKYLEAA